MLILLRFEKLKKQYRIFYILSYLIIFLFLKDKTKEKKKKYYQIKSICEVE